MSHDVFISYCSEDKEVADAVCAGLEARKIRCWIAPRDVPPGESWGRSIVHAIAGGKIMVVIFSGHTNRSRHVMNEIERAVSHEVTIIPFRIEAVTPSEDIELFISSCHWLDALTPPIEAKIGELAVAVQRALGKPAGTAQPGEASAPSASIAAAPRRPRSSAIKWAAAALFLLLAAAGAWFFSAGGKPSAGAKAGVKLLSPPDGAVCLGPTQLSWSSEGRDKKNLEFELVVTPEHGIPSTRRFSRNSYSLREDAGPLTWRVRPVWVGEGTAGKAGPWSEERKLTWYPDALERILATKTIHVGTAESENIFVLNEDGEFTGFDVELLRRIGNAILRKHGSDSQVKIDYTHCVWGEELFRMPHENHAVDLLASGISITREREEKYRLVFSDPILEYPQTLVTRRNDAGFSSGRLVPRVIAATADTTNAQLAEKLAAASGARFVPYEGTGTYDRMFADLLNGTIDSILLDKPYALEQLKQNWPEGNAPVSMTDALPPVVEGVEPEKIGLAFRISDSRLAAEVNEQIRVLAGDKPALIRRFFPQPEAFLGHQPQTSPAP